MSFNLSNFFRKIVLIGMMTIPLFAIASISPEDLRLKLIKARLIAQKEKIEKALEYIEKLSIRMPRNYRIMEVEADIWFQTNHWQNGLGILRKALEVDPHNALILFRERETTKLHKSFAKISQLTQSTGSDRFENFFTIDAEAKLALNDTLGIKLETDYIKISEVRRSNGVTERFRGDRSRGEIFRKFENKHGSFSKHSFYFAQGVYGVGSQYHWLHKQGYTLFEGQLQYPSWAFITGVLDRGTKDKVAITQNHRYLRGLSTTTTFALNRYGLDKNPDKAKSTSFSNGVTYIINPSRYLRKILGLGTQLSINYLINAEYFHTVDKKIDSLGIEYKPLDASSREVHTLGTTYSKELLNSLDLITTLGYSVDRFGNSGPALDSVLTYIHKKKLEASFVIGHSISDEGSDSTTDKIGVNFKWNF